MVTLVKNYFRIWLNQHILYKKVQLLHLKIRILIPTDLTKSKWSDFPQRTRSETDVDKLSRIKLNMECWINQAAAWFATFKVLSKKL